MAEEAEKVGNVSLSRYEQIVSGLRSVIEQQKRGQFTIGDRALEVEPMRQRGGASAGPEWTVRKSLGRLADHLGLKFSSIETARGWLHTGRRNTGRRRSRGRCTAS
jgi:hypothetical protein